MWPPHCSPPPPIVPPVFSRCWWCSLLILCLRLVLLFFSIGRLCSLYCRLGLAFSVFLNLLSSLSLAVFNIFRTNFGDDLLLRIIIMIVVAAAESEELWWSGVQWFINVFINYFITFLIVLTKKNSMSLLQNLLQLHRIVYACFRNRGDSMLIYYFLCPQNFL